MARNSGFIKDTRVWDSMKKNLLKGNYKSLDVGFFDEMYGPENDNLYVAQVAKWQEEGTLREDGTEKIPERPFFGSNPKIRAGFIPALEKKGLVSKEVCGYLNLIALGKMSWTQMYHKIGPDLVKMLQKEIEDWTIPMNAPMTVDLKGGINNPLIDTGKMLDSVEYRVADGRDL